MGLKLRRGVQNPRDLVKNEIKSTVLMFEN